MFENKQTYPVLACELVFAQIAASVFLSLILWIYQGFVMAYSALLGGVTCGLATWLMVVVTFGRESTTPGQMLTALYLGEASKMLVTIGCFILAFMLFELHAAAFILTYIAILALHWLALLKTEN